MLSMLLLLAAAPQAETPAAPALMPATIAELAAAGAPLPPVPRAAGMPVIGDGGPSCDNRPQRAADPGVGRHLMWRENGQAVGLYRLLDRRVNGCPAPIIVNYRVPGSDALGREMGRDRPIPRP